MKEAVSVSKLNLYIKDMFAQNKILGAVYVKGEVSNIRPSRGNYYFSLKDEGSSINCIIFSAYAYAKDSSHVNASDLTDGMKVCVHGKVAVYDKNGTYSIYVNDVENTGLGDYFIKLEELKKRLLEKGMFDDSYKKEIPKYSINIGVVTAETGAAIEDIRKTIKNKNPYANIYLYPSLVQGDTAYETIVDGIMTLDKMGLDVIIIGRGGGSIEDLYCFNDERVAYAIFNASTPIISAVGHEINDSISDLVADLRVATPTAAGEAATFSYQEFIEDIESRNDALDTLLHDKLDAIKERLENQKMRIDLLAPKAKLATYKERIKSESARLDNLIDTKLQDVKSRYNQYIERLKSRDIIDKLKKGFSYTINSKGKNIKSIKQVKKGDKLDIRVSDGHIKSLVI